MPSYLIAFWNLENLFAPEGFAGREAWIAEAVGRDLAGWDAQLFGAEDRPARLGHRGMDDGAGRTCSGCARSRTATSSTR